MKIYHYCYHVNDGELQAHNTDLKPFLEAAVNWDTSYDVVSSVTSKKGSTYLIPVEKMPNFYLLVETKEDDAVQKIQKTRNGINATNILKNLKNDEGIGFASYVYFDEKRNLFSFTGRLNAPTVAGFTKYIHDLFQRLHLGSLQFEVDAIQESIDKETASNLPVIGRTTITVNNSNPLYQLIADHLIGKSGDEDLIESLQVVIKPKFQQNIRMSAKKALTKLNEHGLESIRLKGKTKEEDKGSLKEYRVIEEGHIFSEVKSYDLGIIYEKMKQAVEEKVIQEKYDEYLQRTDFSEDDLEDLEQYYEVKNWPVRKKPSTDE